MPRYIDADALLENLDDRYTRLGGTTNHIDHLIRDVLLSVIEDIDDMPIVDAVEVVRCKDCEFLWKYCDTYDAKVEHAIGDCSIRCLNGGEEQFSAVAEDDYCSLARRAEKDA